MHNHESDFRSPLRPEKVLEAFRELTAGKRWEITSEGAHRVRARSGPTLRGMGEDMDREIVAWLRAWEGAEAGTGDR